MGRSRSRSGERQRRRSRSRERSRSPRGYDEHRRRRHSSRERNRSNPPRQRERSRSRGRPRTNSVIGWYAPEYDPIQAGSIDGTDTTPHDKALVRALNARFDPSRDSEIQGDPYATLFVARLNYVTTEETLQRVFSQYGRIRRIRLVRDRVTQQSKGYAFIEYTDERGFRHAYHSAHRMTVDGSTILVDFERSRVMPGWKPRRLGGGLGGKKESGQLRFGGRDRPFKPPR